MTTTDWLQVDSHILTMTNSESAPDLFGGDLFGDELMDMYNSDAVVGGSVDDSGDIPTLLLSGSHAEHTPNKIDVHVSAEIAMIAAAMDDGLGAFRPSTSFNDFSSLLTSGPAVVESSGTVVAAIAESCQAVNQEVDRKRSIADDDKAGPETKKRDIICKPSSPRRQNTPKPITVISGISTAATHTSLQVKKEQHTLLQNRGEKENTPNPLSLSVSVPAASLVPRKSDPVKYVAPGSVGTTPAVVSPRIVATVSTSESFPPDTSAAISATGVPQNQSPSAATEADFIAVAQAAVSNLILNAGSEAPPRVDATKKCVDVSTAHIKALTSTNWVTACSGSDGSAENDVTTDSKANRARRQNLNPDERARQNRDRNREHARNTRLRKKAYVEELKRTLTELVAQRDSAEVEKRHSIQRELEQREVRFRVMEELLNLRGRNEPNFTRWIAILEEEFSLTLPFTTFREMAESKCKSMTTNVKKIEQAFTGAAEVMEDSRSIAAFLQTLGNENTTDASSSPITLLYHCDRKNFFMDGCSGVLVWSATSVGAVNNGAPYELSFKGNMRATFSPASNKLISAEIQFDTGSIVDQLQDLVVPMTDDDDMEDNLCEDVVTAAQAAANEAHALLDSLQMPQLYLSAHTAVSVGPETSSTAVSVTCSDKSDCSSDESIEDGQQDVGGSAGLLARRGVRRVT